MSGNRQVQLFAVVFGALVACLSPAVACGPKDQEKKKVKVTVVVILATTQPGEIDPRLKVIAKEVQTKYKELKSFKLESMSVKSLEINKKEAFPLVENREAHVIIRHGADEQNRVSLTLFPPKCGGITYRTVCGKFLPVVTRCDTRAGEKILFAVRVEPCNGK